MAVYHSALPMPGTREDGGYYSALTVPSARKMVSYYSALPGAWEDGGHVDNSNSYFSQGHDLGLAADPRARWPRRSCRSTSPLTPVTAPPSTTWLARHDRIHPSLCRVYV
jgi:hypothetical protein